MPEETKDRITTEDACRDFAKVARLTDENGKTVIYENGRPKYVMRRHKAAFEELAK